MPIATSEPNPATAPRARNVTAVLGPTNTGKTHLAIERMIAHSSGMIGLPLRLLAREVYDRIAARIGADKVALVTGEEKIKPESPRFWVSTVEAMPRDVPVDFLAVDEIQLAADPERGHVFTDRLLHARGLHETLLLGAGTMRDCIRELLPGANFVSRPRLSKLVYAGQKKISRLPRRSAIVAFSAAEVYEIAELLRRQRGGAAVVLGALSPRTRNAQVALFQSGDVEYLVATDAIGMGLNLDLDHVAFAQIRKFDGHAYRNLTAGEIGQVAGRAGRHLRDGTFGVTGEVEPLAGDLVECLEKHEFEPVKTLQWRNASLDFSSLDALKESLRVVPSHPRLTRARAADDVDALEQAARDESVKELARGAKAVERLWDVCQVPDYRKLSSASHAELVVTLYKFLASGHGRIPEDWFAEQIARSSKTDGDIDTIANRISHIRTCTFIANRVDWLEHPEHWQGKTREIEDLLSDALHELLTQRFVDQRTSVLMKRLRDEEELSAEIAEDGAIHVEKHYVGRLKGFQFAIDAAAEGLEGKAARQAAAQVLGKELGMRARRVVSAKSDAFRLTRLGRIEWRGDPIGRLERSDDPLKPQVVLMADEHLAGPDRERVQERLQGFVNELVEEKLKPLAELSHAEDVSGMARGIAFRLKETFGVLRRDSVAEEIRGLDQEARAQLRKYGVRFGAFNIYFPLLLKPAASELLQTLASLWGSERGGSGIEAVAPAPRPGLTSIPFDPAMPADTLRIAGFQACGPRAVRIDMLERLADMIRPLTMWRANEDNPVSPPKGATGDGGFTVIPEMMSILGCSQAELGEVLKSLGFWCERKPAPAPPPAKAPEPGPAPPPGDAPAEAIEVAPAEAAAVEVAAEPVAPPAVPAAAAEPEAAPPEAPAEPPMIEVWRPRRRRHEGEARFRHRERGGEERAPQDRPRRRRGRRGGERAPQPSPTPAPEAPVAAASGEPAAPARALPEREARPQRRETRRDGRPPRHPRHDRGDRQPAGDQRRDGRPPREERRQAYDPDSPFAKLAALKQQLEQGSKEQTPS